MITDTPLKKETVPPLVRVREVATLLSISRDTVHNLIDSGDLKASEINPATKEKERKHMRVTRRSLLGFYRKRFGHSLVLALAHPYEP